MAGSSFGTLFNLTTFGESHGPAIGGIIEGFPPNIKVDFAMIQAELDRRKPGQSTLVSPRKESDTVSFLSGFVGEISTGTAIGFTIPNDNQKSDDYANLDKSFRPSHADYTYEKKYGIRDHKGGGRSSARETACRVVAGALAKQLLSHLGVGVLSHVVRMGEATAPALTLPTMADLPAIDTSEVRCFSQSGEDAMIAAIKAAAREGDSLGGIVEVIAHGVPIGLGSHVHWDRKIDALLAQAIMSIQAVKAVEIGDGWEIAGLRGSEAHDPISWDEINHRYVRDSHRSGGTEGGITTGEPLIVRVAMKPLSTLNRPTLKTVDTVTKEETVSFKERTDVTAVPAMGVIAETMVALVLAAEAQRKFGGDSLSEFVRNATSFRATLES